MSRPIPIVNPPNQRQVYRDLAAEFTAIEPPAWCRLLLAFLNGLFTLRIARATIAFLLLLLSACSALDKDLILKLHERHVRDDRSSCFGFSTTVTGGAIVPSPTLPAIPGWYGSGAVVSGRAGMDGARVEVRPGECKIENAQPAGDLGAK